MGNIKHSCWCRTARLTVRRNGWKALIGSCARVNSKYCLQKHTVPWSPAGWRRRVGQHTALL